MFTIVSCSSIFSSPDMSFLPILVLLGLHTYCLALLREQGQVLQNQDEKYSSDIG